MRETIEYMVVGILLFSHGYYELLSGYRMLFKKEKLYNLGLRLRIAVFGVMLGDKARAGYEEKLQKERNWFLWACWGVLYGCLATIGGGLLLWRAFSS